MQSQASPHRGEGLTAGGMSAGLGGLAPFWLGSGWNCIARTCSSVITWFASLMMVTVETSGQCASIASTSSTARTGLQRDGGGVGGRRQRHIRPSRRLAEDEDALVGLVESIVHQPHADVLRARRVVGDERLHDLRHEHLNLHGLGAGARSLRSRPVVGSRATVEHREVHRSRVERGEAGGLLQSLRCVVAVRRGCTPVRVLSHFSENRPEGLSSKRVLSEKIKLGNDKNLTQLCDYI